MLNEMRLHESPHYLPIYFYSKKNNLYQDQQVNPSLRSHLLACCSLLPSQAQGPSETFSFCPGQSFLQVDGQLNMTVGSQLAKSENWQKYFKSQLAQLMIFYKTKSQRGMIVHFNITNGTTVIKKNRLKDLYCNLSIGIWRICYSVKIKISY